MNNARVISKRAGKTMSPETFLYLRNWLFENLDPYQMRILAGFLNKQSEIETSLRLNEGPDFLEPVKLRRED